jgi:hypothetical protein
MTCFSAPWRKARVGYRVQLKDGPEEHDAVQVFARMLVEDYGYPKSHIRTRPQ